jgi:hypothetical protein
MYPQYALYIIFYYYTVQNNYGNMFCNVWYVKFNVVNEIKMVIQNTL